MPKSKDDDLRPYAWEKVAFLEDANEDSRIPDAAYRVLQKICAAFNRKEGYAECARTFIVDRVPVTVKTVQRARKLLLAEGRVFIVREPVGRASTRYGVNWWYRGADKVRSENGGKPIFDVRYGGTLVSKSTSVEGTSASCTDAVEGTFMTVQMDTNVPSMNRRGDIMSPKPIYIPPGGNIDIKTAPGSRAGLTAAGSRAVLKAGRVVEISDSRIETLAGEMLLHLKMPMNDGGHEDLTICVESKNVEVQSEGQRRLEKLCQAIGLDGGVDDPSELHGKPFIITGAGAFLPCQDEGEST